MTVKEQFNNLSEEWKNSFLGNSEDEKNEFLSFLDEIEKIYETEENVTPAKENIFRAFTCDFSNVKVVLIGQDPYPNKDWACGLAFAFGNNDKPQQSLANIFKELELEGFSPKDSSLQGWAEQGVLLMNTALTFAKGKSEFITKWQKFTTRVLTKLNSSKVAFILLGGPAQKLQKTAKLSDNGNIFKAGHPSNLYQTAQKYFFPQANKELFLKCNEYLKSQGINEIDWSRTK